GAAEVRAPRHRRRSGRDAVARRAEQAAHPPALQGARDRLAAEPGVPILPAQERGRMIPAPKLDDRTYADIVAEALRLIPRYCPEWTNHNPSDPGITVLELASWMTELILYRLNRVPEKNYLAFLDL